MKKNEKIIGFRRVRGRVIPISGHIAGNAGAGAVGFAGLAMLHSATGSARLQKARRAHSHAAGVAKYVKLKFNLIDTAHQLKDMSTSDFMSVRNGTLLQAGKNSMKMGRAKSVAKSAIRELRFAAVSKKLALGLGALSLGAIGYQIATKKKSKR